MKPSDPERVAYLFEANSKGLPLSIPVQDAAALTGISVSKLNLYRLQGGGPRFMRFGRSVRYRLGAVVNWMDRSPDYASMSEAPPASRRTRALPSASTDRRESAEAEAVA